MPKPWPWGTNGVGLNTRLNRRLDVLVLSRSGDRVMAVEDRVASRKRYPCPLDVTQLSGFLHDRKWLPVHDHRDLDPLLRREL